MNQALAVSAVTGTEDLRLTRSLQRLYGLAQLMDDQFELPLIRYRIGLDPLIGLIPGAGDWVTWIVSSYIFLEAMYIGAPASLLLRMGLNVAADLAVGYIPGVGDVADAAFKANKRNVQLLLRHFGAREVVRGQVELVPGPPPRRGGLPRFAVGFGLIALFLVVAAVPAAVVIWYLQKP